MAKYCVSDPQLDKKLKIYNERLNRDFNNNNNKNKNKKKDNNGKREKTFQYLYYWQYVKQLTYG